VSYHFNGTVKHASRRSEIRSATAITQAEEATCCDCQDHFHRAKDDENVLKNNVAGNDTWVYVYDVETERQSSQWISTLPGDPKQHAKFAQT
jgi:hypothetical protein